MQSLDDRVRDRGEVNLLYLICDFSQPLKKLLPLLDLVQF